MFKTIPWAVTFVLLAGCSGKQVVVESPLDGPYQVEAKNLYLPGPTVANNDVEAIRKTIQTMCDGSCERVFLSVDGSTPPETVEKFANAVAGHPANPDASVVPADADVIEIADGTDCTKKIFIEEDAGYVEIDGAAARPDITCEKWDATICRSAETGYDWPRLRSVVGEEGKACIALGEGTSVSELIKVHAELRNPDVAILDEARSAEDVISQEDAQKTVNGEQGETDWCWQQVTEGDPTPTNVGAKLAIDWTGKVVRTEMSGDGTSPRFLECVEEVLTKIDFPVPKSAAVSIAEVKVEWSEAPVEEEEE